MIQRLVTIIYDALKCLSLYLPKPHKILNSKRPNVRNAWISTFSRVICNYSSGRRSKRAIFDTPLSLKVHVSLIRWGGMTRNGWPCFLGILSEYWKNRKLHFPVEVGPHESRVHPKKVTWRGASGNAEDYEMENEARGRLSSCRKLGNATERSKIRRILVDNPLGTSGR